MPQRVLIVEDDDTLRYAMSHELSSAGYEVAEAHDYRDALEALESGRRFPLLIVDLVLPHVNGFALARMARMRHHNIKIIYMTGFENLPLDEADGVVLHKPIPSEVLLAAVSTALQGAGRRRGQKAVL